MYLRFDKPPESLLQCLALCSNLRFIIVWNPDSLNHSAPILAELSRTATELRVLKWLLITDTAEEATKCVPKFTELRQLELVLVTKTQFKNALHSWGNGLLPHLESLSLRGSICIILKRILEWRMPRLSSLLIQIYYKNDYDLTIAHALQVIDTLSSTLTTLHFIARGRCDIRTVLRKPINLKEFAFEVGNARQSLAHATHDNIETIELYELYHRVYAPYVGVERAKDGRFLSLFTRKAFPKIRRVRMKNPCMSPVYRDYVENSTYLENWRASIEHARKEGFRFEHQNGNEICLESPTM